MLASLLGCPSLWLVPMLAPLTVGGEWQFVTAPAIAHRLSQPVVKVPPPVLGANGYINKEYFGVLAAKDGPFVTNEPPTFPHDYLADRIERCVNTQAIAQTVHNSTSAVLDLKTVQAYVGQKVTPSLHVTCTYNHCLIALTTQSLQEQDLQPKLLVDSCSHIRHAYTEQGKVVCALPTIGFMNMPGPPGECGGTMFGTVREPTMKHELLT